jgi:hypothetical protein
MQIILIEIKVWVILQSLWIESHFQTFYNPVSHLENNKKPEHVFHKKIGKVW